MSINVFFVIIIQHRSYNGDSIPGGVGALCSQHDVSNGKGLSNKYAWDSCLPLVI